MKFCEYKYLLGFPNKGLHTHYFGFAIMDLIMTIIVAFIMMLYFKKYINRVSHSLLFGIILLILLIAGEFIHKKVCLI